MDYLTYRLTNMVLLFYITYISVDLVHVIVIPWAVRLYVEIIHSQKLVDYLHVQADKHGITVLYH